MVKKKAAYLTSDLIATKGSATPTSDTKVREASVDADSCGANNVPLNFRVSADFKRRFRIFAASHDLKLNELLQLSFDEYEKLHR